MSTETTPEAKDSLLRYYGTVQGIRGDVATVQAIGGGRHAIPKIELSFPLRAYGDVSLYLMPEEARELRRHLGQALETISHEE